MSVCQTPNKPNPELSFDLDKKIPYMGGEEGESVQWPGKVQYAGKVKISINNLTLLGTITINVINIFFWVYEDLCHGSKPKDWRS